MGIALNLKQYLDGQGIAYEAEMHARTDCAAESAAASQVDANCVAKAVVLSTRNEHVVAVVPASRQVELDQVGGCIGQPVALTMEPDLVELFPDCEIGAIPPIGAAYGLRTVVDDSLDERRDVYFEAGDHRTLVHVSGDEFHRLMRMVSHGRISAASAAQQPDETIYFGA